MSPTYAGAAEIGPRLAPDRFICCSCCYWKWLPARLVLPGPVWGSEWVKNCVAVRYTTCGDLASYGSSAHERSVLPCPMAEYDRLEGNLVRMMTESESKKNLGEPSAVLLIDDNAIQAATRQTILRRAGYYVIAALNPVRALDQFRKNEFPAPIGAIITDHLMPGMSGSEFVRELRKTNPDLPVMVISGLEEAEPEYEGLNARFLLKPLSPELLLSNLEELLGPFAEVRGAA